MTEPEKLKRPTRTTELTIRVNQTEYEQIKNRQTGKTFAGWLRQVALGIVPIHQADAELVRNLGRIGSNLNQITKHANTEKTLDQNVLNEITAIRLMMHKLIEQNLADAVTEDSKYDR